MFDYLCEELDSIERSINATSTRGEVYQKLRSLGLSDFGELMISLPNSKFTKLSSILPRMAADEVQKCWTGSSGVTLLKQTLDFVRSASYNYSRLTGLQLDGKKILDFGCGYGRISRMMYYFTSEENVYGVDPWNKSIEICNNDGLTKNFFVSDYLPSRLPINGVIFDFIFAFSVFTHLSHKATITCFNTLSNYLSQNGVILITIRPIEYWDTSNAKKHGAVESLKETHKSSGFAFLPP